MLQNRSWKYLDLLESVADRIDLDEYRQAMKEGRDYDLLFEEMDSSLIYTADQWTMIEEHSVPNELTEETFNLAWNDFMDDLRQELEERLENEPTKDSRRARKDSIRRKRVHKDSFCKVKRL